jgi:hypothetical protein
MSEPSTKGSRLYRSPGPEWPVVVTDDRLGTGSLIPDDGGSTHLWNVDRQSFYTAVYPRRQLWTPYSPPWELEISQLNPLFVDLVTLVITYLVTSFHQHLVVPFISLTVVKTNVNRQNLSMFVSTEIWAWRHCKQNRETFILKKGKMNAERAKYFCVPQAVRNWRRKFWHLELSQGQSVPSSCERQQRWNFCWTAAQPTSR